MRATITRYIEALKKRRASDEGFSLIELIVVVAILGILVAIAVPVFNGLQDKAKLNSIESIAANAATQVASTIATTGSVPATTALQSSFPSATFSITGTKIDDFCVTATGATGKELAGVWGKSGTSTGCSGSGAGVAP